MRVVCAPDSFKHALTAAEAAAAMGRGVRAAWPDAEVVEVPLSDGGEGFTDAIADALGTKVVDVPVVDAPFVDVPFVDVPGAGLPAGSPAPG